MTEHALIFDLEQTLAATAQARRTAWNIAFDRLDVGTYWSERTHAKVSRDCRPGQEAALWEAGRRALGQGLPRNWNRARIEARARRALADLIANGTVRTAPGIGSFVQDMHSAGVTVAIVSDACKSEVEAILTPALSDRASTAPAICIGVEDLAMPEIGAALELACDRTGLREEACVVISGRGHVLRRARQLGFPVLAAGAPDADRTDWPQGLPRLSSTLDFGRAAAAELLGLLHVEFGWSVQTGSQVIAA